MPKFRKKPIVIEAKQFKVGLQPFPPGVVVILVDINEPERVIGEVVVGQGYTGRANLAFGIHTLEGWHIVTDGDWIITGIKGERYEV